MYSPHQAKTETALESICLLDCAVHRCVHPGPCATGRRRGRGCGSAGCLGRRRLPEAGVVDTGPPLTQAPKSPPAGEIRSSSVRIVRKRAADGDACGETGCGQYLCSTEGTASASLMRRTSAAAGARRQRRAAGDTCGAHGTAPSSATRTPPQRSARTTTRATSAAAAPHHGERQTMPRRLRLHQHQPALRKRWRLL